MAIVVFKREIPWEIDTDAVVREYPEYLTDYDIAQILASSRSKEYRSSGRQDGIYGGYWNQNGEDVLQIKINAWDYPFKVVRKKGK